MGVLWGALYLAFFAALCVILRRELRDRSAPLLLLVLAFCAWVGVAALAEVARAVAG